MHNPSSTPSSLLDSYHVPPHYQNLRIPRSVGYWLCNTCAPPPKDHYKTSFQNRALFSLILNWTCSHWAHTKRSQWVSQMSHLGFKNGLQMCMGGGTLKRWPFSQAFKKCAHLLTWSGGRNNQRSLVCGRYLWQWSVAGQYLCKQLCGLQHLFSPLTFWDIFISEISETSGAACASNSFSNCIMSQEWNF